MPSSGNFKRHGAAASDGKFLPQALFLFLKIKHTQKLFCESGLINGVYIGRVFAWNRFVVGNFYSKACALVFASPVFVFTSEIYRISKVAYIQ